MNKEDIKNWLDQMCIKGYTINDDLTIDVDGDVDIRNKNLKSIPVKFGRVIGGFYCYGNQLTSLEGCPKEVTYGFYCSNNQLTSIEGLPQNIGSSIDCSNNKLTSLEGCPKEVNGHFYCYNNKLKSLEGCPKSKLNTYVDMYLFDEMLKITKKHLKITKKHKNDYLEFYNEYGIDTSSYVKMYEREEKLKKLLK